MQLALLAGLSVCFLKGSALPMCGIALRTGVGEQAHLKLGEMRTGKGRERGRGPEKDVK